MYRNQEITPDTPIVQLTVGELMDVLSGAGGQKKSDQSESSGRRLVYGLDGIAGLFGVSKSTAQRYKNTIIRDAVIQECPGGNIVVDADKALSLFANHRTGSVCEVSVSGV